MDNEKYHLLRLLNVLLSNKTDTMLKKDIISKEFHIRMTEKFERRMDDMCNLSKGVWEDGVEAGIEQGKSQGILSSIKSLMESLNMTAEQAMDALKLSAEEKTRYVSMLKSKNK